MPETRRVYLRCKGQIIGVQPEPVTVKAGPKDRRGRATVIKLEGDAQFPVYLTDNRGEWEAVDLTKHDDGTFGATFVASGRQLSVTPDGLESRPHGPRGAWETFRAHEQPPDWSTVLLYRADAVTDVLQVVA